ncbi:MAG: hypothetical protein IKK42_00450 [Oscillospiraceae bacterium]|nr:hypothetical protein [Oscillospiraceae bacterium]
MNRRQIVLDEFSETLKNKIEKLDITKVDIAQAAGVSDNAIRDYIDGSAECAESVRKKILDYLRSREFYRGYRYIKREKFAELFKETGAFLTGSTVTSWSAIGAAVGLTPKEINDIKNSKKSLHVRKQYELLLCLYRLCRDGMGGYKEGFREVGEGLKKKLGLNYAAAITEKYADLLNEILEAIDYAVSDKELAELADIPAEDVAALRTDNDYPYDVLVKCDLLDIIRYYCKQNPSDKTHQLRWRLNWLLMYFDSFFRKSAKINLLMEESKEEARLKVVAEFRKYPMELQNIILNHRYVFFNDDNCRTDPEKLYDFPLKTVLQYGLEELFGKYIDEFLIMEAMRNIDYAYIGVDRFTFFSGITELFRILAENDRQAILDEFSKGMVMPLPCWSNSNERSLFLRTAEYCDMIRLAEQGKLLDAFDSRAEIANINYGGVFWEAYNQERTDYMLSFGSYEWRLWTMLTMSEIDFGSLLNKITDILKS